MTKPIHTPTGTHARGPAGDTDRAKPGRKQHDNEQPPPGGTGGSAEGASAAPPAEKAVQSPARETRDLRQIAERFRRLDSQGVFRLLVAHGPDFDSYAEVCEFLVNNNGPMQPHAWTPEIGATAGAWEWHQVECRPGWGEETWWESHRYDSPKAVEALYQKTMSLGRKVFDLMAIAAAAAGDDLFGRPALACDASSLGDAMDGNASGSDFGKGLPAAQWLGHVAWYYGRGGSASPFCSPAETSYPHAVAHAVSLCELSALAVEELIDIREATYPEVLTPAELEKGQKPRLLRFDRQQAEAYIALREGELTGKELGLRLKEPASSSTVSRNITPALIGSGLVEQTAKGLRRLDRRNGLAKPKAKDKAKDAPASGAQSEG